MGAALTRDTVGPLPEADWDEPKFQRWVVATARSNGWRVRVMDVRTGEIRRGQRQDKGWPDLLLVKDRLVWIELKAAGKVLRDDQREVIDLLRVAGAEVHVFDPRDWQKILFEVL